MIGPPLQRARTLVRETEPEALVMVTVTVK